MDIFQEQIKDLIRTDLIIPDNQRGYDWKEIHADDFWEDIFEIEDRDIQRNFYLGSILLLDYKNNTYEIIDGQQRLTTIFIVIFEFLSNKPVSI